MAKQWIRFDKRGQRRKGGALRIYVHADPEGPGVEEMKKQFACGLGVRMQPLGVNRPAGLAKAPFHRAGDVEFYMESF